MKSKINKRPINKRLEQSLSEFRKSLDENPTETMKSFLESLLEYQFLYEKYKKYIETLPTYERMKDEFKIIRTEFFERQSNNELSEKELQEIDEWKKKNRLNFYKNFLETFQQVKSK